MRLFRALCLAVLLAGFFAGSAAALDFNDEVVAGACITHEGQIRGERTAGAAPKEDG